MGYGALLVSASFLFLFAQGIAARGAINGDFFVVGSIALVIGLVAAFIFFPVVRILASAFQDNDYNFVPYLFVEKLFSRNIWGLGCVSANVNCGVAWNSLLMAILVGASTTLLGLAFALLATRTGFRAKKLLRALTVLPVITPPFVIGLAIILLFGASGTVTLAIERDHRRHAGALHLWPTRHLARADPGLYTHRLPGADRCGGRRQPLDGRGRADPARQQLAHLHTVSLPLMRPGLANAFLVGFIESLADFGNPLVLGGNFDVLSTSIFFAIVGAQNDQGRAAVLAILLLAFTWLRSGLSSVGLGRKSYATVTGKGDAGLHVSLPRRVTWLTYGSALPWAGLTAVIYCTILFGGFVELWGRDHSFTLRHYIDAFSVTTGAGGLVWSGAAWNSFWTTLTISAIAAPLTAAVGLLTAYLLIRQKFAGQEAFEFGTMLSFAIPGTVIGVGYILAFNVPPIELTGTGVILVVCFIFRNMPVGVRAGIAAMSQIDKSLDEASLTLGASSFATVRRVVLPLLRPGRRGRPGLQLRPCDDGHQRGDLPGQRELRHGHVLYHRPGGERRLWTGHCL